MSEEKSAETEKEERKIGWACFVAAVLCFVLMILYMLFDAVRDRVDNTVLILLFAGIACLFFRFLSKIKVGDLLEIERYFQKEVKSVKSVVLRGEITRTERGERFHIDTEGRRYHIPDDQTARFLQSNKGEIPVSDDDLNSYPLQGEMESVRSCRLLWWNERDIFAILNGKKYYVPSVSYLADWQRSKEEYEPCNDREIARYPTGR